MIERLWRFLTRVQITLPREWESLLEQSEINRLAGKLSGVSYNETLMVFTLLDGREISRESAEFDD